MERTITVIKATCNECAWNKSITSDTPEGLELASSFIQNVSERHQDDYGHLVQVNTTNLQRDALSRKNP